MIMVAVGLYELKIKSSILARRGGTDANAPDSRRIAILRNWHVGMLSPNILENIGNLSGMNLILKEISILKIES